MVEKNDVSLETQDSVDVKRNVPSLRFPKFKEKWKTLILDDVIKEFVNGQTPSRNHDEYWKGNIPWLSSGELNYGFINDSIEKITEKGQKSTNLRILPRNTFLIAIFGLEATGTRGSCGILNIPSTISQACMALIPYEEKLKMNFLYYWYNKVGDLYGVKYTQGTKQQNFNIELLKKLSITLPSNLEEQEKIANFLSLIDKKIELLEKTLVLYQKIKKHILEQIFANLKCESESLDKVTFYQEGPGVRNYQYTKEGIKLLNVGNFVENELILENTDRYISEEEAYGKYKHFLVDEGDLLIACSGIKAEYFDEKITFAKKEHLPLCMNTSTMRFKTLNENKLNLNYLKWYFQTVMFKKQIFGVLTGSAQFNFGPTHLKYLKVLIPPIEQQIVISNFLDFLKNHTDKLSKEIYLMKEYKKGLLQKMFV